ncbi:hypothetical protein [Variovorax sp. UC122_21]|uniref:hypothetical protein n=1 Tax=Variovorax sp. UC122_21 TaxID=3374554 RepID=UPI0037566AE6
MALSKSKDEIPSDDTGLPDAIGPHGDKPPTRARVETGGGPGEPPLDFDDDEIYSGRGRARDGGTQQSGADSGLLGTPAEQLSDRNGPTEHRNGKGEP